MPAQLLALTRADAAEGDAVELVAGGRVLVASARKALHGREDLGWVVMLRDRTELQQLTRQLDAVGTMSTALRAQRHEFANQLHTIAGFMSIGQHQQARDYLARLAATGPLKFPVDQAELLQDPYLQAFLGAKGVEADERGVTLRLGPETLVRGQVTEPQEVTTVLGNLIDNAVNAAVAGSAPDRWVEVEVLDGPGTGADGGTLHIVVGDSGDGLPAADGGRRCRRGVRGRIHHLGTPGPGGCRPRPGAGTGTPAGAPPRRGRAGAGPGLPRRPRRGVHGDPAGDDGAP